MSENAPPPPATTLNAEEFQQLVARATTGDARVLPQLRKYLDSNPQIWLYYGDLALQAQEAWIGLSAGKNLMLHESLSRTAAESKRQLGGENPSPIERLLVERVVACWLQVSWADANAAQMALSATHDAMMQKRQTRAQQRYLAAVKAFTDLRRTLTVKPPRAARPERPQKAKRRPRRKAPAETIAQNAPEPVFQSDELHEGGPNRITALLATANRDS